MDDSKKYQSLSKWIDIKSLKNPTEIIAIKPKTSLSFKEMNDYACLFGAWLQTRAYITRSAKIAVLTPYNRSYLVAVTAIWRVGGCVVDLDPNSNDLAKQLIDTEVELVILGNEYKKLLPLLKKTNIKCIVTTSARDLGKLYILYTLFGFKFPGTTRLTRAILEGNGLPLVVPNTYPVEFAVICFKDKKHIYTHQDIFNKLPNMLSVNLSKFLLQILKNY